MVTYSYMAHIPHIAHCTWKKTFDDKVCVIPPSAGIASCHQAVRINACQHWSDSNSMGMDDVSRCLKWQLDALSISYWNVQYWMCCFMIPTEARAAEENAQKQKTSHASIYRGSKAFMDGRMQAFYTKCPSAPGFIEAPSKNITLV